MSDVPHSRQNAVSFFERFVEEHKSQLSKRKIIDLSAGSGYIINLFHKAGASVELFDLFPDQNTFCDVKCLPIDLQEKFPIADDYADLVICGETIEHLPNQFLFFRETARILKPGGTLILTTPNSSSLRSRFSQFLMESEHYSTPAPNELNAYTKWKDDDARGYFSKIFISGILRLRTLAALSGLDIKKVHTTPSSSTSWLLMIFYPALYYFSRKNFRKQLRDDPSNERIHKEIFKLNTSVSILTNKHLIVEWQRQADRS